MAWVSLNDNPGGIYSPDTPVEIQGHECYRKALLRNTSNEVEYEYILDPNNKIIWFGPPGGFPYNQLPDCMEVTEPEDPGGGPGGPGGPPPGPPQSRPIYRDPGPSGPGEPDVPVLDDKGYPIPNEPIKQIPGPAGPAAVFEDFDVIGSVRETTNYSYRVLTKDGAKYVAFVDSSDFIYGIAWLNS